VQCQVETVEKGFFARVSLPTVSCCGIIPGHSAALWRGLLYISKSSHICLYPSLLDIYVQPLSLCAPLSRGHPIMDDLLVLCL
jgi:hypothetical protein